MGLSIARRYHNHKIGGDAVNISTVDDIRRHGATGDVAVAIRGRCG